MWEKGIVKYIYRITPDAKVDQYYIGEPKGAAAVSFTGDVGVAPSRFEPSDLEKMYEMGGVSPAIPPPEPPAVDEILFTAPAES